MKNLIVFFLCVFGVNNVHSQSNVLNSVSPRSSLPLESNLRFIPVKKGQFSAAQPSSFVALPAIKQTTPPVTPVLFFSPVVGYVPDSSLLETSTTSKSLYPIKNVTLKKE